MKLKIKHLAPYLPYGLNTRMSIPFDEETITEIVGLTEEYAELIGIRKTITEHFEFSDIKPILIPLDEFKYYSNGLKHLGYRTDENNILNLISQIKNGRCNYDIMQMCFKEKIDVFGLIEQGLAVSVTNELNPYK